MKVFLNVLGLLLLSLNISFGQSSFVVESATNVGNGKSLEEIIAVINNHPVLHKGAEVTFSPSLGSNVTIPITSEIRITTEDVVIDGGGEITINGSTSTNTSIIGFKVEADGVQIKNMKIISVHTGILINADNCVISNNAILHVYYFGIYIAKSDNKILGNEIRRAAGTSLNGIGVVVRDHAINTIIGGDLYDPNQRNVIHGFSAGIYVSENNPALKATGTIIQGNVIGQSANTPGSCGGQTSLGGANGKGIVVDDYAYGTLIGPRLEQIEFLEDHQDRFANIICGNIDDGITVATKYENQLEIYGNYIGVDMCGEYVSTQAKGISIEPIAKGVQVGSSYDVFLGNVIARNSDYGMIVSGQNCLIEGNIFNTDRNNTLGIGNTHAPISISAATIYLFTASSNITVRDNVIVGNNPPSGKGIRVRGVNHLIEGNQFGFTRLSGEAVLIPGSIYIETWGYGGTTIINNEFLGANHSAINIVSSSNMKVYHNIFGKTILGDLESPNLRGVYMRATVDIGTPQNARIGGAFESQGNLFVNNTHHIFIQSGNNVSIQGNYVGVDFENKVYQSTSGIRLENNVTNAQIGGDRALGLGNVVAGVSTNAGIYLTDAISNVTIQGNIIGLDPSGTRKTKTIEGVVYNYKNEFQGIIANGTTSNITVGGLENATSKLGNIIGNNRHGVIIYSQSGNNYILGNYIGTGITGQEKLGNLYSGCFVRWSKNLTIGTEVPGTGNTIANNSHAFRVGHTDANNVDFFQYSGNKTYETGPLVYTLPGEIYNNGQVTAPQISELVRTGENELKVSVTSATGDRIDVYAVEENQTGDADYKEYLGYFNCPGGACSEVIFSNPSKNYSKYKFTSTTAQKRTSLPSPIYEEAVPQVECQIADYFIANKPNFANQKTKLEKAFLELSYNTTVNNPEGINELLVHHEDGVDAWSITQSINVIAYKVLDEVANSYEVIKTYGPLNFSISESNPLKKHTLDISDIIEVVDHFEFTCLAPPEIHIEQDALSLISSSVIQANVGFEKSELYDTRHGVVEQSGPPVLATSLTASGVGLSCNTANVGSINFSWTLPSSMHVKNYDLQVLKLEPELNDADNVVVLPNWDNAATIEVKDDLADGSTNYSMTLAEGTGFYIWRVRPIGDYYEGGRSNVLNYGTWSQAPTTDGLYSKALNNSEEFTPDKSGKDINAGAVGDLFYYTQFDEDINFIYSKVLSEGSRQAETITYANGLSMTQQVQTKLQSKGQVIATQSVNDYTGRPALQSLPAPINCQELGYKENFFQSSGNAMPYMASDFDEGWHNGTGNSTIFTPNGLEMTTNVGPQFYYSNANDGGLYDKGEFVPNAKGVPYVRTLYSNDPSGRVVQQSGPGEAMKIGNPIDGPNNTFTSYTSVEQQELDLVFGSEAPFAKDVYKVVTTDPNKVTSVAYITKAGQTIATCLDDNRDLTNMIKVNQDPKTIVGFIAGGEIDEQTNTSHDVKTIDVAGSSRVYTFNYDFTPKAFNILGNTCDAICKTCDYRLDLEISDLNNKSESPYNAVAHLELDQSTLNCNNLSQLDLNNFKVIGLEECPGSCAKIWSGAANFSVNSMAPSSFAIEFQPGKYAIEKRVFVNNKAPEKDKLFLEDQIDQMRDNFSDWSATNQGCLDGFTADQDPESDCETNIYCEADGSFGAEGSESFNELSGYLKNIVGREIRKGEFYNSTFLKGIQNKYNQYCIYFDYDEDFYISFLDQFLKEFIQYNSNQGEPKTCEAFSESVIYADLLVKQNRLLKDKGAVASKVYLVDHELSIDTEESNNFVYNDELDLFQVILDEVGYEDRGLNATYYCMTPVSTSPLTLNVVKQALINEDIIAKRTTENPNHNWHESLKIEGCTNAQAVVMKGYIEVPDWATTNINFRIRRIGFSNAVSLKIGDVSSEHFLCDNCNDVLTVPATQSFLPIEIIGYNGLHLSNRVVVEWETTNGYEIIPPFYYHPTCNIKKEIVAFNGSAVAGSDPEILYLKLPESLEIPWDMHAENHSYSGNPENDEMMAAELLNSFFTTNLKGISSSHTFVASELKNLGLDPSITPTYEETVQRVCEAYYSAEEATGLITQTEKEALDTQFEAKLKQQCKEQCAQSTELYNQSIESYLVEENALRGNFSKAAEIDENGEELPSKWQTSFTNFDDQTIYDDQNRDCYVESIKNSCMNECEVLSEPQDIIDFMNRYPVFKPMGNGEMSLEEFKNESVNFVYRSWVQALTTREVNEPQTTDNYLFKFNTSTASGFIRNITKQPFLVYNYNATTEEIEYFEYEVVAGTVIKENGAGESDDELVELILYFNNKNSGFNAYHAKENGMSIDLSFFSLNISDLALTEASISNQLFNVYFDYFNILHTVPSEIIANQFSTLTDSELDLKLAGNYATLADYTFNENIYTNAPTGGGNFSLNPDDFLQMSFTTDNGLDIQLMDEPLLWGDGTQTLTELLNEIALKINNSDNGFYANVRSANIDVFYKGLHNIPIGTQLNLVNEGSSDDFEVHSSNIFNLTTGNMLYRQTGRLDNSPVVTRSTLDLENEAPDISSYAEGCQFGFNSVDYQELIVTDPNLLPNGYFNIANTCSPISTLCIDNWTSYSSVDVVTTDYTTTNNPQLIGDNQQSVAVSMYGNNTGGEAMCTNVNLSAGTNYSLSISHFGGREAGGAAIDGANLAIRSVESSDFTLPTNIRTDPSTTLISTITCTQDTWVNQTLNFIPTEDQQFLCICPVTATSNVNSVVRFDDLILTTGSGRLTSVGVSTQTFFENQVFPKIYEVLNMYRNRGYLASDVEERRVYFHNEPNNLVQYVEIGVTGSPIGTTGLNIVSSLSLQLHSDCGGTVKTNTMTLNFPAGLGLDDSDSEPIENAITFDFNEHGALHVDVYMFPFNVLGSDFSSFGIEIYNYSGIKVHSNLPTQPFWSPTFNTACQPDYGTCEVCLKWQPLKEYYDELLKETDGPALFPNQQFNFCQEAEKYANNQAELFKKEKLDEAEAAARASFKENCLTNLEDKLTYTYSLGYYHFTRYYYDRAGNLIETVPPQDNNLVSQIEELEIQRNTALTNATANLDLMSEAYDPAYNLNTTYQYNSIGQLISQHTPDGGTTRFWYNALGQLVLSQDAEQARVNSTEGKVETFSYTTYDELGRIVEVGEMSGYSHNYRQEDLDGDQVEESNEMVDLNLWSELTFPNNITGIVKSEVSQTTYSTPAAVTYDGNGQQHLRNRVSYVTRDEDGLSSTDDKYSTYYSYDPHGNVNWMIQDIPGLGQKSIAYEYDLVSGNVNKVIYMGGTTEQFIHRYFYDEDNRITLVETSTDDLSWTKEANYEYYLHGPLARTEIGQDNIQGIDYTYTIEGYLKAINQAGLVASADPGQDGHGTSSFIADEFGMELGYYEGDYARTIGTASNAPEIKIGELSALNPWNTSTFKNENYGLYNGNIAYWTANTRSAQGEAGVAGVHMRAFRYDNLNRLRIADFIERDGSSWNAAQIQDINTTILTVDANNKFDEVFTYDRNGNISTAQRYGQNTFIDELNYFYENPNLTPTPGEGIKSNRLDYVTDGEGDKGFGDLANQSSNNYKYDAEGNLITDNIEGITIDWNVLNKVERVVKANEIIEFNYDASGNRVAKKKINPTTSELLSATYYVRDASGNTMGVYEKAENSTDIKLAELPIYGSDRIGEYRPSATEIRYEEDIDDVVNIKQIKAENAVMVSTRLSPVTGKREFVDIYMPENEQISVNSISVSESFPEPTDVTIVENEEGDRQLMFYTGKIPDEYIPDLGRYPQTPFKEPYNNVMAQGVIQDGNIIHEKSPNEHDIYLNFNAIGLEEIKYGRIKTYVNFPESGNYVFDINIENDDLQEGGTFQVYLHEELIIDNTITAPTKYVHAASHEFEIVLNGVRFDDFTISKDGVPINFDNGANLYFSVNDYSQNVPDVGVLTNGSADILLDPDFEIRTDGDNSSFIAIPESEDYYLFLKHNNKITYSRVNPTSGIIDGEVNINLQKDGIDIAAEDVFFDTYTDYTTNKNYIYITAESGTTASLYKAIVNTGGSIELSLIDQFSDISGVKSTEISPLGNNMMIMCYTYASNSLTFKFYGMFNGNISSGQLPQEKIISYGLYSGPATFDGQGFVYFTIGGMIKRIFAGVVYYDFEIYDFNSSVGAYKIFRGKDNQMYVMKDGDIYRFDIYENGEFKHPTDFAPPTLVSSLAGISKPAKNNIIITSSAVGKTITHTQTARTIGNRTYELKDHLGNVRAVVSDERITEWDIQTNTQAGVAINVRSWADYYAFGWQMPGRHGGLDDMRYGFNGMEKDDEVKGEGNSYDFGARIYDSRLGRFMSTDAYEFAYPDLTPYQMAGNSPVFLRDFDGNQITIYYKYKDIDGNVWTGSLIWNYGDTYDASKLEGGGNTFVKETIESLNYLIKTKSDIVTNKDNGKSYSYLRFLASMDVELIDLGIEESTDLDEVFFGVVDVYGGSSRKGTVSSILYNPRSGTIGTGLDGEEVRIAPVVALAHEFGHADRWYRFLFKHNFNNTHAQEEKNEDKQTRNRYYGNNEEMETMTKYEHKASQNGGPNVASGKRKSHHYDKSYETKGPTTIEEAPPKLKY